MEFKNVNLNGDNIVVNNLINANFLIFESCEIEFKALVLSSYQGIQKACLHFKINLCKCVK
jgi:hypothetical protein